MSDLDRRYDKIVIDSPPILPVADSRVLAVHADCTLCVVRLHSTTRRAALATRDELLRIMARRIEIVVNAAVLKVGNGRRFYRAGAVAPYAGGAESLDTVAANSTGSPARRFAACLGLLVGAHDVDHWRAVDARIEKEWCKRLTEGVAAD